MHGQKKPLVLTILDGWGFSPASEGNAIAAARKPTYDLLLREYPNTLVHTSGPSVGLPEGQMGNSEVGHLNIGAGRIIHMDVTRIDRMIASGEFFNNPVLLDSMQHAKAHRLHLMGLCSDGGVHSLLTHLYALLKMAKQAERGASVSCTALWTAATRRPKAAPATSNNCRKRCGRSALAKSRPFRAATTPWIATNAGIASSARSAPWCSATEKSRTIRWRR